jgi:hypothetical protein
MENIKNYNKHLFSFVVLNLFVLGMNQYLELEYKSINITDIKELLPIPSIAILSTYILNGLLPSNAKYRIVFFRWNDPLPASRFETLIKNDYRFTIDQVIEKYGPIPSSPKQQNIYWYQKIYKPHQDAEKVKEIHRSFLMTRDLTSICLMLIVVSILDLIFFKGSWIHLLIVILEFIFLRQVASNYGKRFVTTVISESI